MNTTLRVLIVEDSESDRGLIVRHLELGGYSPVHERVETTTEMRAALEMQDWDIVLSDYSMPRFAAPAALKLLQESGHDIPFIVVSGSIGEDSAVAMLRAGAHDYVIKSDLARLAPAVRRALGDASVRQERRRAEKAQAAIYKISQAVVSTESLDDLYDAIHNILSDLLPVENFFIALYDPASDLISFPYYVDQYDVPPQPRTSARGLTEYVLRSGAPLLAPPEVFDELVRQGEVDLVGAPSVDWLGVPLRIRDETIGVMAVQSYTQGVRFREKEMNIMAFVSAQVAMAIHRKRAELALSASEERYRLLFQHSPVGVFHHDTQLHITDCNERFAAILQSSKQRLVGLDMTILRDQSVLPAIRQALAGKEGFYEGFYRATTSSAEIWVSMRTAPLFNEQGEVQGGVGIVEDITERVRAEEKFRQLKEFNESIVQNMAEGIAVEDVKGIFTFVNPAAEALLGYAPGELLGQHWTVIIPPDQHPIVQAADECRMRGEADRYEIQLIRKDGTRRTVLVSGSPRFEEGRFAGTMAVFTDITGRAQTEERLRRSEANYRSLFENVLDGIYRTTLDGKILAANPALVRMLGYASEEELQGVDIARDLYAILEERDQLLGEAEQDGELRNVELTLRRKDSQQIIVLDNTRAVRDIDGTILYYEGTLTDITGRKRAEHDLQRRADEFAILYEIARELATQQDWQALLHTIVERATNLLAAPSGAIYLYDAPHKQLELMITKDFLLPTGLRLELGEGMAGQVAQNQQPLIVDDYSTWEHRLPLAEGLPFRASLDVPMLSGGELIGVLDVSEVGESGRRFTEVDARLLSLFAGQAASAVQNARLLYEVRTRAQQLELLYESGLALSQLLPPKGIGQKIIDLLVHILGWHHTTIRRYHPEDETLELLAFSQPGLTDEKERLAVEERFKTMITCPGDGLSGWVVQNDQAVRCGDVTGDPRYLETVAGIRSGLYVPMKVGQRITGVISVESEQVEAFSEADERLITTMATQAAIALENARLFEETKHWVDDLQVVSDILVDLNAKPDVSDAFPAMIAGLKQLTACERASLALLDKNMEIATMVAIDKPSQALGRGASFKISDTAAAESILSGKPHLTPDLSAELDFPAEKILYQSGLRSRINLPLRVEGEVLGAFNLAWLSPAGYDPRQVSMLMQIAHSLALTVRKSRLFEDAQRRLQQVQALHEIDRAIAGSLSLPVTLDVLLNQATTQLGVDAACVLLLDPHTQMLEFNSGCGFRTTALQHTHLHIGEGHAGQAALERRTIYIPDLNKGETGFLRSPLLRNEGFVTYFGVPLVAKGQIVGVLEIFHRQPLDPDQEWRDFMEMLARQAAIAIDNASLFENLQRSGVELILAYDATLQGWARALELRDQETGGHTRRVTDLTERLARAMGVRDDELIHIRRGAILHDIGKMGIPDSILLKPSSLSEEEWEIMRQHPVFAYEMLLPISFLRQALDIPHHHHEKWDGTGYPRGLKGDQIPLAARIFAVVDVWDALRSDRLYREAWTEQKALAYIKEQTGKHFDPQVVEAFLRIIEER